MTERHRHGGCIHEARRFFSENRGGEIWMVTGTNQDEKFYLQNYFIPPNAQDGDLALNSNENGYLVCEPLTVAEVRKKGTRSRSFFYYLIAVPLLTWVHIYTKLLAKSSSGRLMFMKLVNTPLALPR